MGAVRRQRLQLRQHRAHVVRRVLGVDQQPVEAGAADDVSGVRVRQAEPQPDLRLRCAQPRLEGVDGGAHAVASSWNRNDTDPSGP
jgi:hypothetical protein